MLAVPTPANGSAPTATPLVAPDPLAPIWAAYGAGRPAQLLMGRDHLDLLVGTDGRVRSLLEALRHEARRRYGLATVTYHRAAGLDYDARRLDDADRRAVEQHLRAHGLLDLAPTPDRQEVARALRGIGHAATVPADGTWADGRPLRFLFCLLYAEHLAPPTDAGRTDDEIAAVELAHVLAQSLALRQAGHLVLFHGREGRLDDLVAGALHPVRLRQPDATEKRAFVEATQAVYTGARFEAGLEAAAVARLTANTPNRSLEAALRESHRQGTPVSAAALVAQKVRDVEAVSEGTLVLLDTRRVEGAALVGRNAAFVSRLLMGLADRLLAGDPHLPANLILSGSAGTGKTIGALLVAHYARAAAYQVLSAKGSLVGEAERRIRLQWQALLEWAPNVAFADEITEALPLQRTDYDGDGGVTRNITATLLAALSDESRCGRSLLIGTTNCPWRMDPAMRERFTFVPVLQPLAEDFPEIVAALAARLDPAAAEAFAAPAATGTVGEAARLFFEKGASPREVLGALRVARLFGERLTPQAALDAARDLAPAADRASAVYADLWAVRVTKNKRFLPWHGDPTYPFPAHLRDVVDPATGDVDTRTLDDTLRQLAPQANF